MSKLKYSGKPGVVVIGRVKLQPGDVVTDDPKGDGFVVDAASLERLATRSDFGASAKPKPKKKVTDNG